MTLAADSENRRPPVAVTRELGERARAVFASNPRPVTIKAILAKMQNWVARQSLTPSRAPNIFLYMSLARWMLDGIFEKPWDSVSSARVQLWELEWYNPHLLYQKRFVAAGLKDFPTVRGFIMMTTIYGLIPDDTVGFVDDRSKDVTIMRRPGAKTTIVAFSGLNLQMAGISWTMFDRAIASKLNANLVVFKDFNRRLYLAGVTSLGDYETSIAKMKEILSEFEGTHLIATGGSGGVFGAINCGCDLGIDHIVVVAGPTSLQIGESSEDKQVFQKIAADAKAGLIPYPDLPARVNATGVRRVEFFVAADHEFDFSQMRNLADNCTCVVPHIYENYDKHLVIDKFIADGTLLAAYQ